MVPDKLKQAVFANMLVTAAACMISIYQLWQPRERGCTTTLYMGPDRSVYLFIIFYGVTIALLSSLVLVSGKKTALLAKALILIIIIISALGYLLFLYTVGLSQILGPNSFCM